MDVVPVVKSLTLAVVGLVVASILSAQEARITWPAQDLWRLDIAAWANSPVLTRAHKVFVRSSLPPEFATVPSWFSIRYAVVDDPKLADIYVFVRPGVGGNFNPDILVTNAAGERRMLAFTPLAGSISSSNLHPEWTNRQWFQYFVTEQDKRDAKDAKKAAKHAKKHE
jgi:hypothetical protein